MELMMIIFSLMYIGVLLLLTGKIMFLSKSRFNNMICKFLWFNTLLSYFYLKVLMLSLVLVGVILVLTVSVLYWSKWHFKNMIYKVLWVSTLMVFLYMCNFPMSSIQVMIDFYSWLKDCHSVKVSYVGFLLKEGLKSLIHGLLSGGFQSYLVLLQCYGEYPLSSDIKNLLNKVLFKSGNEMESGKLAGPGAGSLFGSSVWSGWVRGNRALLDSCVLNHNHFPYLPVSACSFDWSLNMALGKVEPCSLYLFHRSFKKLDVVDLEFVRILGMMSKITDVDIYVLYMHYLGANSVELNWIWQFPHGDQVFRKLSFWSEWYRSKVLFYKAPKIVLLPPLD